MSMPIDAADALIAGKVHDPGGFLAKWLAALVDHPPPDASPGRLFDVFRRPSGVGDPGLAQRFEIVGRPGRRLEQELQSGDLLLRSGEAGFTHVAVIVEPDLHHDAQTAGLHFEGPWRGFYVHVAEPGWLPHASAWRFARRLCRPDGHVLADTMILRARVSPDMQAPAEDVPLALPSPSPQPTDAALRSELQRIGNTPARALDAALASVNNRVKFENLLLVALKAAKKELGVPDRRFTKALTRLGAEAFVRGLQSEDDDTYAFFVDRPSKAGQLSNPQSFLDFAVRRLLELSAASASVDDHRAFMERAALLIDTIEGDLARDFPAVIGSRIDALTYRTLLVEILWRHYQAIQDRWLGAAAKTRLSSSVLDKDWTALLATAAHILAEDSDANLPMFRMTPTHYRDYFSPAAATDIGYSYYTPPPHPPIGDGPSVSFIRIVDRRQSQRALIAALVAEADGSLPDLHSSASWQKWLRALWDRPVLRRRERLDLVLEYVRRYFEEFTASAPLDLHEGCGEKNYLTRTFPRAVTGALVHDCQVYAARWLHMLGGLFAPGATATGISNPKLFLVEMPAHVGVMIRADIAFLGDVSRHLVIGINNQKVEVHTQFDAGDPDTLAAEAVVHGIFKRMRTPFVLRRLSARPSDASALWAEICGLSARKLALPYADPAFPPHARYLDFNMRVGRIALDTSNGLVQAWFELRRTLDGLRSAGGDTRARQKDAIARYAAGVQKAVDEATARHKREVEPLIAEIDKDLADNKSRIASGVLIAPSAPELLPWEAALLAYRPVLEKAQSTLDVSQIRPDDYFAPGDFAADLE